jgi:hypothetical protein
MKILFLADNSRDMSSAYLFRGLREVVGDDNVADPVNAFSLQGLSWCNTRDADQEKMVGPLPAAGHRIMRHDEDDFDMLVAVTSMLRTTGWDGMKSLFPRVKKGGKIVWFDTLDSPLECFPPPFQVDAVFKREIQPSITDYAKIYGFKPLACLCAAPEVWFENFSDFKPRDVFCVQNATTTGKAWPARWNACTKVFQTNKWHDSMASSRGSLSLEDYMKQMPQYKFCVCCPGGGDSSDSTRMWEALATGSIPIMAGHNCRVRPYWFSVGHPDHEEIFECTVDDLPKTIDRVLDLDLKPIRDRMKVHALKYHTTKARAEQFIHQTMNNCWKDPPIELAW